MSTVKVDRRHHVLAFVSLKHVMQKRKYTGHPYTFHLQEVARLAENYKCVFGYEIGLCHDLLEDTDCTGPELHDALRRFGYDAYQGNTIVQGVIDLTDVYTAESFPDLNRAERKRLEALRLHSIPPNSQTIKYCDLMDNTKYIVEHDKSFAKKYLQEKEQILAGMTKGNKRALKTCLGFLEFGKAQLDKA